MGDVFTGTQTADVPSGHPGLLCSENTPAELKKKTTGSRKRQSSYSACQAHYSNMVGGTDTCEGACYSNLEEVPHMCTYTKTHTSIL